MNRNKSELLLCRVIIESDFRCNDNAQLFHNVERLSFDTTSRLKFDCHERMGRCVHVFHICEPPRVRVRQLRRTEATTSQRRLSSRRESRNPGTFFREQFINFPKRNFPILYIRKFSKPNFLIQFRNHESFNLANKKSFFFCIELFWGGKKLLAPENKSVFRFLLIKKRKFFFFFLLIEKIDK